MCVVSPDIHLEAECGQEKEIILKLEPIVDALFILS